MARSQEKSLQIAFIAAVASMFALHWLVFTLLPALRQQWSTWQQKAQVFENLSSRSTAESRDLNHDSGPASPGKHEFNIITTDSKKQKFKLAAALPPLTGSTVTVEDSLNTDDEQLERETTGKSEKYSLQEYSASMRNEDRSISTSSRRIKHEARPEQHNRRISKKVQESNASEFSVVEPTINVTNIASVHSYNRSIPFAPLRTPNAALQQQQQRAELMALQDAEYQRCVEDDRRRAANKVDNNELHEKIVPVNYFHSSSKIVNLFIYIENQ
jgi:hypothetical protein